MNSINLSTIPGETVVGTNPNPKPIEPSKQHRDSVLRLIVKLATAMNVEISDRTQHEYYLKLVTLRLDVLARAVERLIDSWIVPHTMPPVATLLEFCREVIRETPTQRDTRRILDRGDKPPDWEPVTPAELEQMRQEAAEKARALKQQVADVAKDHTIKPGMTEMEFEARRQKQLDEFRRRNQTAGEA